jgi:hypothetical protein
MTILRNKTNVYKGTCKVRNEIETKRKRTKRNQTKLNETDRNETNETKRRYISFRFVRFRFVSFLFWSDNWFKRYDSLKTENMWNVAGYEDPRQTVCSKISFLLNPLSKEGTCKVRNEIETKRNQTKRNRTKRKFEIRSQVIQNVSGNHWGQTEGWTDTYTSNQMKGIT